MNETLLGKYQDEMKAAEELTRRFNSCLALASDEWVDAKVVIKELKALKTLNTHQVAELIDNMLSQVLAMKCQCYTDTLRNHRGTTIHRDKVLKMVADTEARTAKYDKQYTTLDKVFQEL